MSMDDWSPCDTPRKRRRLESCEDGLCGGCHACLTLQGYKDEIEDLMIDEPTEEQTCA
jgi:hypothetical protein